MKKNLLSSFFVLIVQVVSAQYSFDSIALFHNLKLLSADDMEGRKTGSEGGKKARTYIIDQLKKVGVAEFVPGYEQPFTISQSAGTITGTNILAVLPGKKKETIVISAHYDHLGIRNNSIYNGTDDNASGISALLAIAEYFRKHKPNHRLIFAFFDAEEMGLRGSAHFVNNIDLPRENIVLNINLDMVSRSEKKELYASGGFSYPDVQKKLQNLKTPKGITLLFGHDNPSTGHNDWTNQSDQYNFHQKKIPFIYFGVEDHPDYHRAADDFEKINTTFYARSVETILMCVKTLDQ
ncbi:MAG TPA: M28 family peptidase [Cyclobacteriaceae bacterium]|nr:M28 family peptidase [Cyclobacteriaceae bacterium]